NVLTELKRDSVDSPIYIGPKNSQTGDTIKRKSFLRSYWSTKPDTSVPRKLRFAEAVDFGVGVKFENYNSLHQFPWLLNMPGNSILLINCETKFGNPDKFFLSVPLCIGASLTHPKDYRYKDSNRTYTSSSIYTTFGGGLMIGQHFFNKSSSPWLKIFTPSAGIIYNYGILRANVENTATSLGSKYNYYIGNFEARFQLSLEYPKKLYAVSKRWSALMHYYTFAVKLGYDLPLGQSHWYNPGAFPPGTLPSVSMGGFYFSIAFVFRQYMNKELAKKQGYLGRWQSK
ncbi:MAG TPA: hypothetical protein VNZ45_02735, partial [Bacteroidia bacterium]|nr:hypothetical protein [Bacteroidia bacterium]